ncbi:hypothetical protein G6F23_015364 [Rhizopus arrhizus]|nr:hypothetical protein G6F23_015364 [Rhizopus arrhizus]
MCASTCARWRWNAKKPAPASANWRSTTSCPACRTATCGWPKPSRPWRAPNRNASAWRCCSWTWTASSRSTTPWAIPSATPCCATWPSACAAWRGRPTSSAGCPATSS